MSNPNKPEPRLLFTVLAALWLTTFAYSFVDAAIAFQSAIGLSSAASVLGTFLGWQGVAGLFALACFGVSRAWPKGGGVRRLGAVPLGLAGLLLLGFLTAIIYVSLGD